MIITDGRTFTASTRSELDAAAAALGLVRALMLSPRVAPRYPAHALNTVSRLMGLGQVRFVDQRRDVVAAARAIADAERKRDG